MVKVAIVILNWNGKKDTIDCLNSVYKLNKTNLDLKVILVDNNSTDDSVKVINKLNFNKLKIIINKTNLGFAGGNNVGIKYALKNNIDYVLILNNDTVADKDLLIQLIKVTKSDSKIGAISPLIYFAKGYEFHKKRYKENELGKVIWSAGGNIDWKNVFGINNNVDEVDKGKFVNEEIDFATGACVLYKAEILKKIGLYNDKYFLYLEDVDLSVRIKRGGYKILFAPKAKVWHKVAQSSGIGSGLNDYFITRNRLFFGIKYAGPRVKIALFRESINLLFFGRKWQRIGTRDFYLCKFYKGSWK